MKIDDFVYKLCTEGKNFASLATLMSDGSPQVSVTWVDSDGEYILINTAEGRVKAENMRRDARVAVSVTDSGNPYRQAMVRGRVEGDTYEGAEEHINRMARKYLKLDTYPRTRKNEKRVIFRIKPEKVFKLT
ncbi:MAG TPA: PPOX class F420-dependent oxidoreductase [Thermodesulfobacteriota bacterium]|nr:PPOX class F420-dependent oxidoreductase [Thermodesulfobacteriota bacterium]